MQVIILTVRRRSLKGAGVENTLLLRGDIHDHMRTFLRLVQRHIASEIVQRKTGGEHSHMLWKYPVLTGTTDHRNKTNKHATQVIPVLHWTRTCSGSEQTVRFLNRTYTLIMYVQCGYK